MLFCLTTCLSRGKMRNRMEGSAGANGPVSSPSSPTSSNLGPPLSPEELGEEPQSSLTDITQMWVQFAKTFAIILPIYILGYFEFSFSWVLIGLATLFYWRKNHGSKDYRINRALAFMEHEEKAVRQSVPTTDLPPWVSHLGLIQSLSLSCHYYLFWTFLQASQFPLGFPSRQHQV